MFSRITEFGHATARALKLPNTATAPFCPSEVQGIVEVAPKTTPLRRFLSFAGPGLLVAVGYMDPGNWATDIAAGSQFGYGLLFIVLLSALTAMLLQVLAARLGLVARLDLAQACRAHYPRFVNLGLWGLAELAIVATDIAEVLGAALAFKLLFGLPLMWGIILTSLDLLIVLGLKGRGFRQIEAIILSLVTTIGLCFLIELFLSRPSGGGILMGAVPDLGRLADPEALYLAIGIVGATVMPHNLYLHSSIVQTRKTEAGLHGMREAITMTTLDTVVSLVLAAFVNAAILILAASAFHAHGHTQVADIEDAKALLSPLTGAAAAGLLFAIALFASGQSSTFTGTIAGQVILEGFLDIKIPCWQRRVITRVLAIVPALIGIAVMGEHGVGSLLVLTQVVLSLKLPFAVWPLVRLTGRRDLMGDHATPLWMQVLAWFIFAALVTANAVVLAHFFMP